MEDVAHQIRTIMGQRTTMVIEDPQYDPTDPEVEMYAVFPEDD